MCKPQSATGNEVIKKKSKPSSLDGGRAKTPITFSRLTEGVPATAAEVDALWHLYCAFVEQLWPAIDES